MCRKNAAKKDSSEIRHFLNKFDIFFLHFSLSFGGSHVVRKIAIVTRPNTYAKTSF